MTTTIKNETPFTETVGYLERGTLNAELTEHLGELVKAGRQTGRKGTLSLKINVALMKGSEDAVMLTSDIDSKPPKHDRAPTIMFSTYDGDLLRDDPVQANLELREVEKKTAPLKTVGGQ